MILSRSAEYGLRIAAFLALQDRDTPFASPDVARVSHIPPHYSSKILRKLVSAGILKSARGKGGGFRIASDPVNIKFIHVLEAIEGTLKSNHCVFGLSRCGDRKPCLLHDRWSELKQSFHTWAAQTTLADVAKDANKRRRIKSAC